MSNVDGADGAMGVPNDSRSVLHWYDFMCPFCYVARHRNDILTRAGFDVIELPLRAHPEIPPQGRPAGPREGPMYALLEREARQAGLTLNWPPHLPDTRQALATAEWTRRHQPAAFGPLSRKFFEAHFVLGEDLGDRVVIDRKAGDAGVDLVALHAALANGSADRAVMQAGLIAREHHVRGTPAWLVGGRMIAGLLPASEFERLATQSVREFPQLHR